MKQTLNSDNIIHQDVLRQLEALCTAEEPPACSAACPLHLDVRGMMPLVEDGNWKSAFKLYQKAIPFANIVAHTCDAPCQAVCKRVELGGAVNIQLIEKAVAKEAGAPAKTPFALPNKPQKVAIIGGGLRGMTAADYLARKGYKPSIFEESDALGGWLRALPEEALPSSLLEAEIKALLKMPVTVEYGRRVAESDAPSLLEEGFAAVFIACASSYNNTADGETMLTDIPGLVAGRRAGRMTGGDSSVYDVFDGRSAAIAIDRLIQGVSVSAGREKEGSAETRLFTSLDGLSDLPAVPPGPDGYDSAQASEEAARCIRCECLECVKKCAFMAHYKGHPRRYVREVYNNLSIAMGNHDANSMINTCALCGQCGSVCPGGLDMSEVFLAARQRMVKTGKMPQSAHEFALLDMDYSLSDAFFLARCQPGHETSRYVFFPGCQLAASEPELVKTAYEDLCGKLEGGVGLMLGCCGVMAHWAGNIEKLEAAKAQLLENLAALGNPTVIAGCPTCAETFDELYGVETKSIFALPDMGSDAAVANRQMRLHHACGARHDQRQQDAVRQAASRLGVELLPGEYDVNHTSPCCGYGGLLPFVSGEIADEMTAKALAQITPEGNEPVLTYCVNCRDRYLAAGKESYHLLELVYPAAEGLRRKSPTWSARQDNRAALKRLLLRELWNETTEEVASLQLYISDELEQKLEKTHILHSDIAAAIEHAETENEKFLDNTTGRFTTSYRPANVTFWVEYTPEGDGWRVHNAYSHRMAFILTEKLSESGAGDNG